MTEPDLPLIRPRSAHSISRDFIDPDALKVLYRLRHGGFRAFLVGGSVRDLLLGRTPKDFDIGTDARPEDIRLLFRNSRLIGRRFRLAHILFRAGKVIEVATFRKQPDGAGSEGDLLVTSDNTYGTPEEDATRRDFTINGLFYDISDFSVVDYVGGLADLEAGLIRTIGDPAVRFREDPVRMLRAAEFATRLSFAITPADYAAILEHRKDLSRSSVPRVAEEILAILRGGHALPTFLLLREAGLLDVILPELSGELRRPDPEHAAGAGHFFWSLLEVLDAERRRHRIFDDAVLTGVLAMPILRSLLLSRPEVSAPTPALASELSAAAFEPIGRELAMPRESSHRLRSMLMFQFRYLTRPEWKASTRRFLFHPDFSPGLDLFELAAMAQGRGLDQALEWRRLAGRVADAGREFSPGPAAVSAEPPRRRRRRRGGRGRKSTPAP